MIIDLPKNTSNEVLVINDHMRIEDGILKLTFPYSLRNAMYILTYQMKGKHKCAYCQKEIFYNKVTLDHTIPQDFGGPTITNNLEPCCNTCNQEKSNMTKEHYLEYTLLDPSDKKAYLKKFHYTLESLHKLDFPLLPKEWVEEKSIENIIVNISLSEDYKGAKYQKTKEYFEKYGHFQKTIILDKKNFLLDGFTILMYAKTHNIKSVPVIVLENVEVIL